MTITLDWKSRSRSAGTRTLSAPPSRVAAGRQRARVRRPSRPLPWGRSTGRRRTAASQAARASAPEARGAAHAVRCRCADASHPEPRGHGRCSGPATAQSSAGQSSSPRRHPRSCDPALRAKSPESAASRSDHGLTGASLPDPLRSDDQQPAPWLASATHGAPAYALLNNPGILNPSPSPGPRMTGLALLGTLQFHLLASLLAGLLVYELVHLLAPSHTSTLVHRRTHEPPNVMVEKLPLPPSSSRAQPTVSRIRAVQNAWAKEACSSSNCPASWSCDKRITMHCEAVMLPSILTSKS